MNNPCDGYFAGYFDGEGCVELYLRHNCAMPRLRFSIRSANLPTLEMFQRRFGGSVRTAQSSSTNKAMFVWDVGSLDGCYAFAVAIAPYSIEKKSQVDLALHWLAHRKSIPLRGNRNQETLDLAVTLSNAMATEKRLDFNFPKVVAACG